MSGQQPTHRAAYHHGDLRAELTRTAEVMLENGEELSIRTLARRTGVSPAAPYRHFADEEALESALAVHGLQQLMTDLTSAADSQPAPSDIASVSSLTVAYVHFALQHPAAFRLMFGQPCNDQDDERVRAARVLHTYLNEIIARAFPDRDVPALAVAAWSLAHGLAFLHLDGKLPNSDQTLVDRHVEAAVRTVFSTTTPVLEASE